jgi:hypothetical protein
MLKQIPASKINYNKKILRTEENEGKITIHCSDNTRYAGDILVGSDGAYSGVRQNLYRQLDAKGLLPKSDLDNFSIGFINMVGVATPDDPAKFPVLKDERCHFSVVVGGVGGRGVSIGRIVYSFEPILHPIQLSVLTRLFICSCAHMQWGTMSVPNNQYCWSLGLSLSESEAKSQQFRNSEWGPESVDAMYKAFEDAPHPLGGTMGDIMKHTPRDRISKVFLEEKIFKTWYGDQTVLVGDGKCHDRLCGSTNSNL